MGINSRGKGDIMEKFYFYNPVKIYFGEGSMDNLKELVKNYKNVLLCYGKGSIKENGIYDKVKDALVGKNVFELSGIMPNPRTEKVYEGIETVRKENIDLILAVGGGSTIDCAKAISAGAYHDGDFWEDLFINKKEIERAVDIGTVLTMAGTGSEMDSGGVISNIKQKIKTSYGSELLFPKFSILDPTLTYSLPKYQLISGTVDMMSHIMEEYFSMPDYENTTDAISEGLLRSIIENIRIALKDPVNYRARANLMWASTLAINGLTSLGKRGDWISHKLEHTLSAYYDITHGMGLSIVHPNYLKYVYKNHIEKFKAFAVNVWDIDKNSGSDEEIALKGIEKLKEFFKEIGAPTSLREVNIPKEAIHEMSRNCKVNKTSYSNLDADDIEKIYNMAY